MGAGLERVASELCSVALNCVEEGAVVAVDILADGNDRDAPIGYSEVCEVGPGEDEGLVAGYIGNFGSMKEVPGFLGVGCEF